jgi:CheY-like chemotaxis protein
MASIEQLAVLVVDDDPDTSELLQAFLEGNGARVRLAASADEARAAMSTWAPDVILTDVNLPGEDGFAFVARLRTDAATRAIPAIAVTGHADAQSRQRALDAGFQKFITKPFDVFALPAAIASVVADTARPAAEETADARISRLIAERDMRALLSTLNGPTPYRYTSILRFDDEKLESVWTFDRVNQSADTFPPDLPVSASYCALIRTEGAPFSMNDSLTEPRAHGHLKRDTLRAYCGVPLFRADGSMFGTLCHYDEQPQAVAAETVDEMLRIASLLTPVLDGPA